MPETVDPSRIETSHEPNPDSGRPAHARLSQQLRDEIERGVWEVGDRLPSEHELGERYQVSRTTVRRALQSLEASNLVYRRQGAGTFVAERQLSHGLGDLRTFTQVIRDRGLRPGTRDVHVELDPHPPVEAVDFLPSAVLWKVRRLRTVDDRPLSVADSWLPDEIGRQVDPDRLESVLSLYRVLEEDLGVIPQQAVESIRAEPARSDEAVLLGVPHASPLIVIYRWTRDARHAPLELARSASPGDRHEYVVTLRRQ